MTDDFIRDVIADYILKFANGDYEDEQECAFEILQQLEHMKVIKWEPENEA